MRSRTNRADHSEKWKHLLILVFHSLFPRRFLDWSFWLFAFCPVPELFGVEFTDEGGDFSGEVGGGVVRHFGLVGVYGDRGGGNAGVWVGDERGRGVEWW